VTGKREARYDVNVRTQPWVCDCGDYVYRKAGIDPLGCKHCKGLRSAGADAK
jgi:hypothetical protein